VPSEGGWRRHDKHAYLFPARPTFSSQALVCEPLSPSNASDKVIAPLLLNYRTRIAARPKRNLGSLSLLNMKLFWDVLLKKLLLVFRCFATSFRLQP
jgi:hypothetical protein